MAYKKYIHKGGKKFGPYYYESYRDDSGKVKKDMLEKSWKIVGVNQKMKEKGLYLPDFFCLLSLFYS